MSSNNSAEEIADDFRHSLEYLQTPDRYAINNFTVIAKENTEHADAISNVLVDHIRKAPPHHKLPSLYVLDSIAKNIGTPYSLFLGHKLYGVFMESYSSVDMATRKKLDEMLKTWKSPVPGSIDPTPVFPPEITRKIESALIQAKTAALKHEQQFQQPSMLQRRPASAMAMTHWRNTPPPQPTMQQHAPMPQAYSQQLGMQLTFTDPHSSSNLVNQQPKHTQSPFQPLGALSSLGPMNYERNPNPSSPFFTQQSMDTYQHSPSYNLQHLQSPDMRDLHRDIDQIIASCKISSAGDQIDPRSMNKVQALLALKDVLNKQNLPADQLILVRRQVDGLQAAEKREDINGQDLTSTPLPLGHRGHPTHDLNQSVRTSLPSTHPPVQTMHHTGTSLSLAELLNKANGNSEGSTINIQTTGPTPLSSPPSLLSSQASHVDVNSMLASLTNSGILSHAAPSTAAQSLALLAEPASANSVAELLALATGPNARAPDRRIQLSSVSLKISRPFLNKRSLVLRPSQCVNCGMRFISSPEGTARKARHMDWHFRANQRIQDSTKGIQSRSWFVGDLEWIKFKMLEDHSGLNDETGASQKHTEDTRDGSFTKYISVPSDPEFHQPCPICQERFDTGFNQEIQDWVWLDAIRLGHKIYHATCYADLRRDEQDSRDKTNTPDSVLGKRKAEYGSVESPMKKSTVGN